MKNKGCNSTLFVYKLGRDPPTHHVPHIILRISILLIISDRFGKPQWLACLPHTVSCGFVPGWVIPKTIIKKFQTAFVLDTHALEYQFDSAAGRFERLDSVWNCL